MAASGIGKHHPKRRQWGALLTGGFGAGRSEAKKADLRSKPRRASGESQLQRRVLEVFSGRGTEGRPKNRDEGAGALVAECKSDVADASATGEPLHRFQQFRLLSPGAETHPCLRLEVTLEATWGHGRT